MRLLSRGVVVVAVAALLGPVAGSEAADGYTVIVNAENPTGPLSRKEVSALFLKKTGEWSHGGRVLPVDLAGAGVRDAFSREVHGRPASAIKSFWQQAIFSGRGVPPPEKASDAEVIAYVRANAGAVGYVSGGAALAGVKALVVTP